MGTTLNDKIISYPVESLLEFNSAYSLPPVQQGTIDDSVGFWSLTGRQPVYESNVGPGNQGGSWRFVSDANNGCRLRNQGSINSRINDQDYSVGAWIRINNFPTSTIATPPLVTHQPTASGGYGFTIVYNSADQKWYPGAFYGTVSAMYTNAAPITLGSWVYYAMRRSGTNVEFYINGSLVGTSTNYTGTSNGSSLNWGQVYQQYDFSQNISNYYIGSYSSVNATAIAEIWQAGQPPVPQNVNFSAQPATASALQVLPTFFGNANILESPATASAMQTEPTIAVTSGDHTEITTSIPVSALMAPATVSTQKFVNITITGLLEATVELINNIIVGSSNSVDFGAQEFLASAILVKPFLSESPMFASAQSGNHTVYVDPNYQNLITSIGPYLYIHDGSATPVNKGYQSGTFTVSSALLKNQVPPLPIYLSGEGLAWRSTDNTGNDSSIRFNAPSNATSFDAILSTGEWAVESWISTPNFSTAYRVITDPSLTLRLENGTLNNGFTGGWDGITVTIKNGSSTTQSQNVIFPVQGSGIDRNTVYHVVVTSTMTSSTNQLIRVWLNTNLLFSRTFTKTAWTASKSTFFVIDSDGSQLYHDEIALYDRPLTNSEIVNHYNFMTSLSPDSFINAEEATANIEIIGGNIIVIGNATPEIKEATATALIIAPTVIAGISATYNASPMTAFSIIGIPLISTGNTILATPAIAYAESVTGYYLNSIYYDYVKANINPYRYVTFDAQNELADYGTDADYAVQPTVVGGTIVNPNDGISGKSAKTAGLSYVTDGVILKESEYNDTWGTTGNEYHAAFWIQKTPQDNSTGLRVIWNLNGHYNNEHIILYQYQGKLTLSFNDGSINFINQTTVNNIDLFDGNRHFIVINVNHVGVNDTAYLYVDGVLVMTVSLGSYRVETINGITNVGPNDEANNYPRMSVGCLITPLGSTSLPVVPTNTKIIVDEIYWAKTAINQAGVTALFNVMPDKDNIQYLADLMEVTALSVNPAISTTTNYLAQSANASALINNVTVIADRNIVNLVAPANASAEFLGAQRLDNFIFAADIMVSTAIFNSGGVIITRSGGPMLATVTLIDRPGDDGDGYWGGIATNTNVSGVNISSWYVLSPWAAWLRATDVHGVMPMSEVK